MNFLGKRTILMKKKPLFRLFILIFVITILFNGCRSSKLSEKPVIITLGAHAGVQEVYQKEIIPAFQNYWFQKTAQKVEFKGSYLGSGIQVEAIIDGKFEADVVALALDDHIKLLKEAGFISHSRRSQINRGIVSRSVIAFGLRKGNPKDIFSWEGLFRKGVKIIHADPKTSGIAVWVMRTIYGADSKLSKEVSGQKNLSRAGEFLKKVEKKVTVMDRTCRAASHTFNRGTGDVLISSENEIKLQQRLGRPIEMIIPSPTILIEYPVALVDKNVDKHGRREVAEAFVRFLWTRKVQEAFARHGFRPVDNRAFEKFAVCFSKPRQVFAAGDYAGWNIDL